MEKNNSNPIAREQERTLRNALGEAAYRELLRRVEEMKKKEKRDGKRYPPKDTVEAS